MGVRHLKALENPIFKLLSDSAEELGVDAYVIGGYVRDYFLCRKCKDIDIVTTSSGIELAEHIGRRLKTKVSVFKSFGTAMLRYGDIELEFVGARKESYRSNSRNPIVEDGTLEDDQNRRDFTINALALSLQKNSFGELLDPFGGIADMEDITIRTPLDPDITFSDDPLRMLRAIRFACQLHFYIDDDTFEAIKRNASRVDILSMERITTELNKIMLSSQPSRGFQLLDKSGLLELIMPEMAALKGVDTINGRSHKDNFDHTLKVLDNVAAKSDKLYLRWAALLHDIGKPRTKQWDKRHGWTFHMHETIGSQMVPSIFKRLKLPLGECM